jgi:hypothetical protein
MKMSMSLSSTLGLAVAALLLGPAPASAQVASQHFQIHNQSSESVAVRVLHSDGSLQKQETIKAGDTHRFNFDWCYDCCGHDKHRMFEVKTGPTLRAAGQLFMKTQLIVMGAATDCASNNDIRVSDKDPADSWTFSTGYDNGHRTAVLTVKTASS